MGCWRVPAVRDGEDFVTDADAVQRVSVVDDNSRQRVDTSPEANTDLSVDQLRCITAATDQLDGVQGGWGCHFCFLPPPRPL